MVNKKLQEVPSERIHDVLLDLKRGWPSSLHMYYFIWMGLKWKNTNSHQKSIKVYCYGAPEEELFLAVRKYQMRHKLVQRIMFHSLMNDYNHMMNLLAETDAINWSEDPIFEAVLEKHTPLIKELIKIKDKPCFLHGFFNLVWLPFEKQNEIELTVPPDMYIGELSEEHVPRVNDKWRNKFPGSDILVRDSIVINRGLGLFKKSDNKLVSWIVVHHYGGLGILYVEDDERRKGYGSVIELALSKYLVDREIVPFGCIHGANHPSLKLNEKLGFKIIDKVTRIMTSNLMDIAQ